MHGRCTLPRPCGNGIGQSRIIEWRIWNGRSVGKSTPASKDLCSTQSTKRDAQARKLWLLLGDLRKGRFNEDWTSGDIALREEKIAEKLADLYFPVMCQVLQENDGCVFQPAARPLFLNSIYRAFETASKSQDRVTPMHEYVKASAAEVFEEIKAEQKKWMQQREPSAILRLVLAQPSRTKAAFLLDLLTFRQLCRVLELLKAGLRGKIAGLRLGSKHEPKDGLLWLIWYVGRLCAIEPAVRRLLTEDARADHTFLLIGEQLGSRQTNQDGNPLNLADPMWAKHVEKLARTSGRPEEGSISAIARSQGVDRYVVRRWKKEGIDLPEPYLEGVQVGINFTIDDILRSYEIAKGKKRGRKPKRS